MTTILVTGASRGIGLELAKQYADEGADVIATCRTPGKAKALNDLVKAARNVRVAPLDVTDAKSVKALAEDLGNTPIDILINNAGIGTPRGTQDYEARLAVFRTNTLGPWIVSEALRDNVRRSQQKKIVTITSGLGSIAGTTGGWQPYSASKAAVNSLMKGLSAEWSSDGILVGIVSPGWVQTDMGGAGAALTPEQSVRLIRQRIAELSTRNSGHFLDHNGKEIAW
jgi:NAD(P)-dependent dehydrogenase (short-subunit alcohol dehydrogenase family)